MAIRVNTNIASLNSQRHLEGSNKLLNKTLERLSSGLRINRAADDAAGLAISEKMRTQIRGFGQAIANAQDAGNLIATAEAGLDQTSQILQRIRELSIQSASDTLVNNDRKKIQEEVNQLLGELDKIAETTEFNTRPLLDGSLAQTAAREDASLALKSNARIGEVDVANNKTVADMVDATFGPQFDPTALGKDAAFTFTILAGGSDLTTPNASNLDPHVFNGVGGTGTGGNTVTVGAGGYVLEIRSTLQGVTTNGAQVDMVRYVELTTGTGDSAFSTAIDLVTLFAINAATGDPTLNEVINFDNANIAVTNQTSELVVGFNLGNYDRDNFTDLQDVVANSAGAVRLTAGDVGKQSVVQFTSGRKEITDDKALTFHVGANEGQYLNMGVQDMRARAMRIEGLDLVGATDDESRNRAQNAIGVVDQALEYVNTVRSRLGAFQNRVEYRLANLEVSRENLAASESRIRDADFASETANLTRAQILIQAGTAVLTQANISPQSVLNLL